MLGRNPGPAAATSTPADQPAPDDAAAAGDAAADQPAANGAAASANDMDPDATAAAQGAPGQAASVLPEAAVTDGQGAALGAPAASSSQPGKGRPPRHVVLQPILDKRQRGAVHGFFKAELRLPQMRTETSQSASKEGSNTVSASCTSQIFS